jgi:hypothetical protein
VHMRLADPRDPVTERPALEPPPRNGHLTTPVGHDPGRPTTPLTVSGRDDPLQSGPG